MLNQKLFLFLRKLTTGFVVGLLAYAILASPTAAATELTKTIPVTQDSYINAWSPNSNYSSFPVTYVRATGQNETQSTVLYFDFDDFPGKYNAIKEAKLVFSVVNRSNSQTINLRVAALKKPVVLTQVNWNQASNKVKFSSPGSQGWTDRRIMANGQLNKKGDVVIDVTSLVSYWVIGKNPNYGLILSGTSSGNVGYAIASKEYWNKSLRPRLVIKYQANMTEFMVRNDFLQAAKFSSDGPKGYAYIKLPGYSFFNLRDSFDLEFWFKPTKNTVQKSNSQSVFIVAHSNGGGVDYAVELVNNQLIFVSNYTVNNNNRQLLRLSSKNWVKADAWHFVRVTKKDNLVYLFLDGVLEDKYTLPAGSNLTGQTNVVTIGCFVPYPAKESFCLGQYEGLIDEFQFGHVSRAFDTVPSMPAQYAMPSGGLWHFNDSAVDSGPLLLNGGLYGDVEFILPPTSSGPDRRLL